MDNGLIISLNLNEFVHEDLLIGYVLANKADTNNLSSVVTAGACIDDDVDGGVGVLGVEGFELDFNVLVFLP